MYLLKNLSFIRSKSGFIHSKFWGSFTQNPGLDPVRSPNFPAEPQGSLPAAAPGWVSIFPNLWGNFFHPERSSQAAIPDPNAFSLENSSTGQLCWNSAVEILQSWNKRQNPFYFNEKERKNWKIWVVLPQQHERFKGVTWATPELRPQAGKSSAGPPWALKMPLGMLKIAPCYSVGC